ncbi:MAG: MBOAT family O-acyltransferase [Solirubrobacterales bacterium]
MAERDFLKGLAGPALNAAHALIAASALPEPLQSALGMLVDSSGLIAIAAACGAFGELSHRMQGRRVERAVAVLSGVVAAFLALWLLQHPSDHFDALFGRWDHLAFAGAAGLAITVLGGAQRKWWLAALSGSILLQYAGPLALSVVVGLTAAGILLWHTRLRSHRRTMIAAQGALVVAAYGGAFWLRTWNFPEAARVQGLLTFWLLRHISLIVRTARSGPPPIADCGAFMAFYPGAMGLLGAPEVYDEFARRNLARPPALHHRRAARRIIEGVLLISAAMLVPVTLARIETSTTAPEAWACSIAFFVRTALGAMGAWRLLDGTALLYGVQLRANFAGLLSCRNPSELWWSWRGTFTNWLVQYVYAPLGASRRHQSVNIAAAFAVSLLWHVLGVPFLTPNFRPEYATAVALWAGVNAAAVLVHVNVTRTGALRAPSIVPLWVRTAVATGLVWALGSLTPILLHYQGPAAAGLPHLLRLLLGVR